MDGSAKHAAPGDEPAQLETAEDRPEAQTEEMSPAQLAEAKAYGRIDLICDLADRALDVTYLAVAAFVLAIPLDAWLGGFALLADHATLRLLGLFAIITLLHLAISLPLSFYSGYVVEHRFGLSHLTPRSWLARYLKRNGLALVFGMAVMAGLYWIIWTVGVWWWIVAAVAFFAVSVLIGQLAPVLIFPLFYRIERLDNPELNERLSRLSAGTGLSIEGVYRMDLSTETAKANAMLAGLGRTRRVLLGDTLLANFTTDEIEVIFAHEIGHHIFRHIRKLIVAGAAFSTVAFWISDRAIMTFAQARNLDAAHADLPVWTLPLLMLAVTLLSMIFEPLNNVVSRHYERQCDRYALERTNNRDAYRSAFRKLARLNKDDPAPHPLAVFLLHSHPPIRERLAMAD